MKVELGRKIIKEIAGLRAKTLRSKKICDKKKH